MRAAFYCAAFLGCVTTASATTPQGLYVGAGQGNSYNPNTEHWSFSPTYTYYFFDPSGVVYWYLPQDVRDLTVFSPAAYCSSHQNENCGTWAIAGNQITFRWEGGSTDSHSVELNDDGIKLDGGWMPKVVAEPGLAPEGVFLSDTFEGQRSPLKLAGGEALILHASGRFEMIGFTSFAEARESTVSPNTRTAGTYRVTGLSIVFSYDGGGAPERDTFFRWPDDKDHLLMIAGHPMHRA